MKKHPVRHNFFLITEVLAVAIGALLIAVPSAKQRGRTVSCINNVKQLSTAQMMYCCDNDDWYPMSADRADILPAIIKTGYIPEKTLTCPNSESDEPTYAFLSFNANIKMSQIQIPSTLPLIICNCHDGKSVVIGFADGHVEERKLPRKFNSYEELTWYLLEDCKNEHMHVILAIVKNARELDRLNRK